MGSREILETMTSFDTLRAATQLRDEAGFDETQARVLMGMLAQCVNESLATKADVAALRSDMERMETALRSDMEKLGQTLTIRMGGMLAMALGIMVALDRLVF